jgi:hypothetical protein
MKNNPNKILTLHPQNKKGVNIDLDKYDILKDYILDTLKKEGQIGAKELYEKSAEDLQSTFDGKVMWYCVTVKLDLEAREIIEKTHKTSPQIFRLKTN